MLTLTHGFFSCSNRLMKTLDIKEWANDWRSYLAEFMGTFLFVLISSLVVLTESLYQGIGIIGISLAIGFSYAALVFGTVHLAGGYLNPAVAMGLWLVQKLSGVKTAFYLIAQVLASFAAASVVLLIFGSDGVKYGLGVPSLGLNISITQAVIIEAIFSAGLIFVLFGTMIDRRGPVSFGPLVLGLYLAATSVILMSISGAALNPARALGPAVISQTTNNLVVWIIGPFMGSLFAIVYEFVFLKKAKK